jgi:GntR family transcriptional regulator of arabinose operon
MDVQSLEGKSFTLYLQVKKEIKNYLKSGAVRPGEKLETENELAHKFGVSRPTVRQALRALQDEGYINRIHGRGTFVAEELNRSDTGAGKPGKNIYMIVPHLSSNFIGKIATGVQEVFFKKGYQLTLYATNELIEQEEIFINDLIEKRADGLIIHPTKAQYYNPAIFKLYERKVPIVMTGRYYRYLNTNFVVADNYRGVYEAISYLIDLGHRHIGLVSKPPTLETSQQDRLRGFQDALSDHNLVIERKLLLNNLKDKRSVFLNEHNDIQEKLVQEQLKNFIENCPEMTAVFAANGLIAASLIKTAKQCNRIVGRDLSVLGFDNDNFSTSLDPALTTVDWPTLAIGRRAAEIMIEQIENPGIGIRKEYLSTKLIIRESCAKIVG